MKVFLEKQEILENDDGLLTVEHLQGFVSQTLNLNTDDFYLTSNGRKLKDEQEFSDKVSVVLRLRGGKGGFGSMLRAIGAQIEKTTNREACRDLSGRRLRDINEEQRLKNWVAQQADREKEAKEKKKKKLEKLLEKPKHTFTDKEYDKERSELPDKVEDAVLQGLEASCSSKRKCDEPKPVVPKKKRKLWLDNDLDSDFSSSGSEDENSKTNPSVEKNAVFTKNIPESAKDDIKEDSVNDIPENKTAPTEEKVQLELNQ